ncbi:dihydrofolate reductase [Podospora conica]|nr:dihydrofolate reductase [Schizothecium conicum]
MGDQPAEQTVNDSASAAAPAKTGIENKKQQRPLHPKPKAPLKKEVRILMLHGYTQSGPLFRAKTRALEKLLAKALAPLHLVPALLYPTAPNRLSPRDIPGFVPAEEGAADAEPDSWAWFRRDEANGTYRHLEEGMMRLAETIAEARGDGDVGIDGVVGFSQGGSVAAMLAAAMEGREVGSEGDRRWVEAVRKANGGRPLRFAVVYSGFWATPGWLGWLYEPKVVTPTLHFLGSLDTVVEEGRSRGLVERCEGALVVVHPGGHYVPVSREWVMPLVGFIRKCVEEEAKL